MKGDDMRNKHLYSFLNCPDDVLAERLTLIETISWVNAYPKFDINPESPFAGFHPEAVRMVIKPDQFYLTSRADHFVLIFGYTEFPIEKDPDCVVCIANHKGHMDINVFNFKDDEENKS
jgi:hypothetical protein